MSPEDRQRVAVRAERLHKTYQLGESASLRRTLSAILPARWAPGSDRLEALNGVEFSIRSGECFGIVGHNGSGKSTILQILAGITVPSQGSLTVSGRVLPLLAVGSGFHPELTGRENIILFGTILGLGRRTIEERIEPILAFGEVERHVDTPMKRYSDGMKARLSFGVAMLFPADIYVFDEVFAIVDGEFRLRCMNEIERLVADGCTVIVTTHDGEQIRKLADRAMWMEAGSVREMGPTGPVMDSYEQSLAGGPSLTGVPDHS